MHFVKYNPTTAQSETINLKTSFWQKTVFNFVCLDSFINANVVTMIDHFHAWVKVIAVNGCGYMVPLKYYRRQKIILSRPKDVYRRCINSSTDLHNISWSPLAMKAVHLNINWLLITI